MTRLLLGGGSLKQQLSGRRAKKPSSPQSGTPALHCSTHAGIALLHPYATFHARPPLMSGPFLYCSTHAQSFMLAPHSCRPCTAPPTCNLSCSPPTYAGPALIHPCATFHARPPLMPALLLHPRATFHARPHSSLAHSCTAPPMCNLSCSPPTHAGPALLHPCATFYARPPLMSGPFLSFARPPFRPVSVFWVASHSQGLGARTAGRQARRRWQQRRVRPVDLCSSRCPSRLHRETTACSPPIDALSSSHADSYLPIPTSSGLVL